jgi:hypothetical protein
MWRSSPTNEYILSTSDPQVETQLRSRIMYGMPTITLPERPIVKSIFDTINSALMSKNFVICMAEYVSGMPMNQVQSFNYYIDYLGSDGQTHQSEHANPAWISGNVMNSIIIHKQKKKNIYI